MWLRSIALSSLFVLSAGWASAQTTTVNVTWDPPLPSESVVSYNLTVDALPTVSIPTGITPSCGCVKTPIAVAVGPHTVKVTAVYLLIDVDPTSTVESAPLIGTFTLNAGAQIKNLKVSK